MNVQSQNLFAFFQYALPVGFKVIMAIICGGLIGLERELKNKSAGIKTNILICLGATLYTTMSILIPQTFGDISRADPGRVAAQVVSGIGFIGAGAIMQSRVSVVGLTTAATIWVVAAIGVCIGAGYPVVGFVFTMTVLFTLLSIDRLESRFLERSAAYALEIVFVDEAKGTKDEGSVRSKINEVMAVNQMSLDDFDISRVNDQYVLRLQYSVSAAVHKKFILDLWSMPGIREVRQL